MMNFICERPAMALMACAAFFIGVATGPARAEALARASNTDPAAILRAKFASLKDELASNDFRRPLSMHSAEDSDKVSGEIHAIISHPFAVSGPALNTPEQWCDILILHLNTKYCRPSSQGAPTVLHVRIGKKFDQPVDKAFRVNFAFNASPASANYVRVNLDADEGPLGTRDYRIVLEAAPSDNGHTLIHLRYAYSVGTVGRVAMQAYLATVGRNKVGFTQDGVESDGRPHYIGGMRGVMERNTMRYYLAIESYLGARSALPSARLEKSLSDWFSANERFPRQLHDIERGEYLDMKHKEYARQQSDLVATKGRT